ncbi:MAG: RNA polymerase sigma factor RpoD/SigA [Brachyspira sp.]|nr:RNA polymerase sigma factor RpoD/SigA [Brachyspira sp.]
MSKNLPVQMRRTSKNFNSQQTENESLLNGYMREISSYPTLTSAEEKELAKLAKNGDEQAKEKLIQANLRLVVAIAKKAIHMSGIPMIDLIQEGNVGLMVAVEKFNYKLGYKFATYAGWWVKQAMFKAISEQSHCMKIPVYIQETLSKYSKIKSGMEKESNAQVRVQDVAKKMNMDTNKIETFLSAYSKSISIESGLEKENGRDMNFADILEDEKASVTRDVEFKNLQNDINMVVSTLKEREQEVVRLRYGLGDGDKMTLEEIGNLYGVTKECIRQTELRALKKLRSSNLSQELLTGYID